MYSPNFKVKLKPSCSRPCLGEFWVSPRMKMSQSLRATCSSAAPLSVIGNIFSLCPTRQFLDQFPCLQFVTTVFFPFTVYFWKGHMSSQQLLVQVVEEDSNQIQPPLSRQVQGEQTSLLPSSIEQQTPFSLITLVAFYWTSSIWSISPLYWGTKFDTVSSNAASKVPHGRGWEGSHFLWAASYALANGIQHADSPQHTSTQYSSKQGPSY